MEQKWHAAVSCSRGVDHAATTIDWSPTVERVVRRIDVGNQWARWVSPSWRYSLLVFTRYVSDIDSSLNVASISYILKLGLRLSHLSKTSVLACTMNATNLPMQRLQSITPLVHMAAHQSSFIVIMHIIQLFKVIGVTLEQTLRELSVL